jgi:hypothetical protein
MVFTVIAFFVNVYFVGKECMIKSLRLSRNIRLIEYSPLIVAVIHSKLEVGFTMWFGKKIE